MKIQSKAFSIEARRILHFWTQRMVDRERGGFYGRIDGHGRLHPDADKGVILNTRILWSFSAAARCFGDGTYRKLADRAYAYLRDHFRDSLHGGVFWMLDKDGKPVETKKQIYAQAFAIYALAEYHRLNRNEEPMVWAMEIFFLIENHSYDGKNGGYLEAFTREWGTLADVRLSEKDANEAKTMNTHLHVLEAYTNLYRVWPEERVRSRLQYLIELFLNRFLDHTTGHLRLFFDEEWQLRSDLISFGHDIEAAWLLGEAAEVLAIPELEQKVKSVAIQIAEATLAEGVDADGGLFNEADSKGLTDTDKHWWPQAEAMVGFLHAYQLSGDDRFYEAAASSWHFIQQYLIDEKNGEWYWSVTRDREPVLSEDKAGPWKAPYHNTRACLEMIVRLTK